MTKPIFIIAEAGVNHNGDLATAKQLVDAALAAGVDCVKFQTFIPENLVSRYAQQADYQKETFGGQQSACHAAQAGFAPYEDFLELKQYCDQRGILFLSTPFDLDSIDFLERLDPPFWKAGSSEVTNLPYLIKIAQTGRPIVLSTGMSEMEDIAAAVHALQQHGATDITLLHCNTQYPTPMQDVNLRAMQTLREYFGLPVGYSDHTLGIEVAIAAAALGAVVIEKHFTLDCSLPGPDHKVV